jgi:hypothetical protein
MRTKTKNLWLSLAIIAIIGFAVIACDGNGGNGDKDNDNNGTEEKSSFTVTFDSAGGTDVAEQSIVEGELATKPANDPTRENDIAGLWEGSPPDYTLRHWSAPGSTEAFDFTTPITANITLTAQWDIDDSLLVNIDHEDITAVFEHVSSELSKSFTLLLDNDEAIIATRSDLFNSNTELTAELTIIGLGGERIIQQPQSGLLFMLTNSKLTLGENITLKGTEGSTSVMISLANGGELTMKEGSKITGHNTSSNSVVTLPGDETRFNMEGGEISGNRTGDGRTSSAVVTDNPSAIITINGGRIIDNFSNYNTDDKDTPADISFAPDPGTGTFQGAHIVLSGSAEIGALSIAERGTPIFTEGPIIVSEDFSGSVSLVNLTITHTSTFALTALADIISIWTGRNIIRALDDGTLTEDEINQWFTLGEFRANGGFFDDTDAGPITPGFKFEVYNNQARLVAAED